MEVRDIIFVSVMLLIAVLAIVGNTVVILAVCSHKRLRNPANYLIVNLALSDLLQGAIAMPLRIAEMLNTTDETLVRCDVVIAISIFFFGASNANLALIALDRYVTISKPLSYPNVVKTSSYKIVIAVTWIFLLVISFSPVAGWRRKDGNSMGSICRFGTTLTEEYLIMFVIVINFIPFVILLVTYTYIFRTTRKQIRQIRAQEVAVNNAAINLAFEYRSSGRCSSDAVRGDKATDENTKPATEHYDKKETVQVTHNNNDGVNEVACSACEEPHATSTTAAPCTRNARKVPLSTVRTRKVTRTVLAIIGLFFVLCIPITVIDAIEIWCYSCGNIPRWVTTVALWMVSANSCVNVFVYGGYNTDYRKAYRDVWLNVKKAIFAETFFFTANKSKNNASDSPTTPQPT